MREKEGRGVIEKEGEEGRKCDVEGRKEGRGVTEKEERKGCDGEGRKAV